MREHVGPDVDLMYDGSAAFDLPSAEYLGRALGEAGYRWYEEPMREFSVTAYRWLADRVDVPLLVGETSDGSHLNTADFIASGCAAKSNLFSALSASAVGLHRLGLRDLRQDQRKPPWRHHGCHADRTPRRLVPAPGGSARADRVGCASLHGDSELHVLRVPRHLEPGDA